MDTNIKKVGVQLSDEELENVSGGYGNGRTEECPTCHKPFPVDTRSQREQFRDHKYNCKKEHTA